MSTLWLLMVPVCTAIYTLLLPIAPNDFWYNVRAGAEIAATGTIPKVALFTPSVAPGTPYFYQSWIAALILFKTLQLGGLAWIVILRTLCLTASFTLIQWAAWRRAQRLAPCAGQTTGARIVALSTLLAFALAAANMDVRPQTFSVPLFCLFAFLVFEWPFLAARHHTFVLSALGVLMLLWVNTHGAFVAGLVLLGVLMGSEFSHAALSETLGSQTLNHWFGAPLPRPALRGAAVLFVLCTLASLLNPRGSGIYSYVLLLGRLEANQEFIQEWQAPSFKDWYGALFFLTMGFVIALAGVLVVRLRRIADETEEVRVGVLGVRFSELLILMALAIMALRDIRSIIWFALFGAPLVAALSTRLLARGSKAAVEIVPRSMQVANAIIGTLLIFSVVPVLPWFKTRLPLPPEYSAHFAPTPRGSFPIGFPNDPSFLLDRDTPVEAVEFFRKHPPRRKIWNDFVYGSYLAWATTDEPRLAPDADPRVEMRPLSFWQEYGRIEGGAGDAASTLKARGFSDALLDTQEQPRLQKVLKAAGWREVFRGGRAVILRSPN